MKRIYLDNAAATPMDPRVLDVMMPYLTTAYGNPSSLHYFGQQARSAVQTARSQVAHCLGVKGEDLVFTSGGTEADNLAILSDDDSFVTPFGNVDPDNEHSVGTCLSC